MTDREPANTEITTLLHAHAAGMPARFSSCCLVCTGSCGASRAYGSGVSTRRGLMALYRQAGRPELVERYRVPPGRFIPY